MRDISGGFIPNALYVIAAYYSKIRITRRTSVFTTKTPDVKSAEI